MSRKKQLIVPVFIPFGGCPNRCVFCDQEGIAGRGALPRVEEVAETIEKYLGTWRGTGRKEVAFYGGSFTGLPVEAQKVYLKAAGKYLEAGLIDGIRVSTRPDYIDPSVVELLRDYGVDTVELGAQSMDDTVLRLSGRGHDASRTKEAVGALKAAGINVGVQIMPGLPGDTPETVLETARSVAALGPGFVRVYPTLVLRQTPLHRMYLEGSYRPWGLEEMVSVCGEVMDVFREAGILIIRMGLQPTEALAESIVAGPYHPSFRQLVESGRQLVESATGPAGG